MASPTQYYRRQLFERPIHYTFKTFDEFRLAKLDYIFNSIGNSLYTYKDFKRLY